MIDRPSRSARPPLLPLLVLLHLLLLLLAAAPSRGAKPRSIPEGPLPPFPPDALLDSILSFAVAPPPDPDVLNQQQRLHQQQQQTALRDEDFVFATGTCRERMHLAKSTRAWRRGVRAFMLTDQEQREALARLNAEGAPHNESFAFFPDDRDASLGGVAHGTKQGDTRAAVAPFAAHRHFGETYKWLLYGDDDTLFFLEPVKRLLSAFDPNLPLALSDNLWYFGQQPNAHAPRCLPCHMANDSSLPALEDVLRTAHVRPRRSTSASTSR